MQYDHKRTEIPLSFSCFSYLLSYDVNGIIAVAAHINCGHTIRGVLDGMFINREKQYSEKENSEEYEKVTKQRALERDIRKQKTTRNALKAAGDDEGVKEIRQKDSCFYGEIRAVLR